MNRTDNGTNQEHNERRETDCKEKKMEDGNCLPNQVMIDEVCDQRLRVNILQALKQTELSVVIEVTGGQIGISGKINVPIKPFLFVAALILADKYALLRDLLVRIVGPP